MLINFQNVGFLKGPVEEFRARDEGAQHRGKSVDKSGVDIQAAFVLLGTPNARRVVEELHLPSST